MFTPSRTLLTTFFAASLAVLGLSACEPADLFAEGTSFGTGGGFPPPPADGGMPDTGMDASPDSGGGSCTPSCGGRTCGPDGCGGLCGSCTAPQVCNQAGMCEDTGGGTCTPNCAGRTCGPDGCGGDCGSCASGTSCTAAGTCESTCTPSCDGRMCGGDGCGGSCGSCGSGETCNGSGMCEGMTAPPPAGVCEGSGGPNVGDDMPAVSFPDNGNSQVALRDVACFGGFTWVYRFSQTCGICRNEMRSLADWVRSLPADRFRAVVIVGNARTGGAPSAAVVDQVISEYGMGGVPNLEVLWDQDRRFMSSFYYSGAGATVHYLNGEMIHKGKQSRSWVEAQIP